MPLHRIQPNDETREKQLETWCDLVLSYARHEKLETLDVDEAAASKLFRNSDIQRALPRDGIVMVLELLAKRGWRLFSHGQAIRDR